MYKSLVFHRFLNNLWQFLAKTVGFLQSVYTTICQKTSGPPGYKHRRLSPAPNISLSYILRNRRGRRPRRPTEDVLQAAAASGRPTGMEEIFGAAALLFVGSVEDDAPYDGSIFRCGCEILGFHILQQTTKPRITPWLWCFLGNTYRYGLP